jgi:hypothetical protein
MIDELLVYCKLMAIQNALVPTEESVFNSFCRAYCKRFYTPLHLVHQMDPEIVIQSVLDDNYEEVDTSEEIEGILEDIYVIENPQYRKQQMKQMDSFIVNMERLEKDRLKTKRDKEDKQKSILRHQPIKSGSVDFTKLNNDK